MLVCVQGRSSFVCRCAPAWVVCLALAAPCTAARPDDVPRACFGQPIPSHDPQPSVADLDDSALGIRLIPPTPEQLSRLESEARLRERIRKEALANPQAKLPTPVFPEEPPSAAVVAPARMWPWYTKRVEPNYLCYDRLYFQQIPFERYGRTFGPMQPLVSAGIFYYDVLAFPLRAMFWPCQPYECSADGYSPFLEGWPRQR